MLYAVNLVLSAIDAVLAIHLFSIGEVLLGTVFVILTIISLNAARAAQHLAQIEEESQNDE